METAELAETNALVAWLRLLGWRLELHQHEELVIGRARHRSGETLSVCAVARSRGDATWQLFQAVCDRLGRAPLQARLTT